MEIKYCKKCKSPFLHTETKGNNIGLYCNDCGAWIMWVGKDEARAFLYKQNKNSDSDSDIVEKLQELVKFLEEDVKSIMNDSSWSTENSIRNHSYCIALEKTKNSIINIINGTPFDAEWK